MVDLKTRYLGLELKNPIIVGASNLVLDTEALRKIEEAGAAAIVYKSLFEEQIQLEMHEHDEGLNEYNERHAEMISLFPDIEHAGPEEFLLNLKKTVNTVNIPVIASLNCVYDFSWTEYALKLQETGVAAIELNFYSVPRDFEKKESDIIHQQIEILRKVKAVVNIPVSVKLSQFYTNPLQVIGEMDKAGANGFVLFNRLFQPDIDIEHETMIFPWLLSNKGDHRLALRFAGLLYGKLNGSVCGNGGILESADMIQLLLAGADSVQVVSTLYKHGIHQIADMLADLEKWMQKKGYKSIADFQGKLSQKNSKDPYSYKRAQYVDILMKSQNIFEKYPMR